MVETTSPRSLTAGNDITTAFPISWYFIQNADIVAKLVDNTTKAETPQTITTHFTLSGAGDENGGTLTMLIAPPTGQSLLIYSDPDTTQGQDFTDNSKRPGATLEKALDKLTMLIQRLKMRADKSVRFREGYSGAASPLLPATITAGAVLAWDADGLNLVNGPTTTAIATAVSGQGKTIVGTRAAPTAIVGATGIPFTSVTWETTIFVEGSGGAVVLSAPARIQAGTIVGQVLTLIGRSDANTITMADGNGVDTAGLTYLLKAGSILVLEWDGTNWTVKQHNGV